MGIVDHDHIARLCCTAFDLAQQAVGQDQGQAHQRGWIARFDRVLLLDVIEHPQNRGYGAALASGFAASRRWRIRSSSTKVSAAWS